MVNTQYQYQYLQEAKDNTQYQYCQDAEVNTQYQYQYQSQGQYLNTNTWYCWPLLPQQSKIMVVLVHGDVMQLDRFPYEKIREEKLPTLSGNQKAHLHARKEYLRRICTL